MASLSIHAFRSEHLGRGFDSRLDERKSQGLSEGEKEEVYIKREGVACAVNEGVVDERRSRCSVDLG